MWNEIPRRARNGFILACIGCIAFVVVVIVADKNPEFNRSTEAWVLAILSCLVTLAGALRIIFEEKRHTETNQQGVIWPDKRRRKIAERWGNTAHLEVALNQAEELREMS